MKTRINGSTHEFLTVTSHKHRHKCSRHVLLHYWSIITSKMKTMMEEERNIKRKKMSKNDKRRFSDEQIRYLELMFESDTKLEPRKKVEVARELGLQPRQVAIWFQNKRARWKSKHIEKEYSSLLASYNTLASQFDSLKKEKQSLLLQLQKLKKESEGARCGSSDGESECNSKMGLEVKNDDSSFVENLELLQENDELLRMSDWGSLDSDDISIINHSAAIANQWWDFSSFID